MAVTAAPVVSTQPSTSLSVTSPAAGSVLQYGQTYNFVLSGAVASVTYYVYLTGGALGVHGVYLGELNAATQNSFTWTVPSTVTAASGYELSFSGQTSNGTVTSGNSPSYTIAPAVPTVSVSVSPTSTLSGGQASLFWSSSGATSCSASASPTVSSWQGSVALSGLQTMPPVTQTTAYILTCTNAGGSNSASATVMVTPAPVVSTQPINVVVSNPKETVAGTSLPLCSGGSSNQYCKEQGYVGGSDYASSITSGIQPCAQYSTGPWIENYETVAGGVVCQTH